MSFNSNFNSKIPEVQSIDSGFSSIVPSIISDSFLPFQSNWNNTQLIPPFDSLTKPMPVSDVQTRNSRQDTLQDISELAGFLLDEDPFVATRAWKKVMQQFAKKASKAAFINSPKMMAILFEVISKSDNLEHISNALEIIYNISDCWQGRREICKYNGIGVLLCVLNRKPFFKCESVDYPAVLSLHLLLLHQESSRRDVRDSDGLRVLVSLMQNNNNNEQFLSIVIDCIRLLVYKDSASAIKILKLGGTAMLVNILQSVSYPNLLRIIEWTLQILSACDENKNEIVEKG